MKQPVVALVEFGGSHDECLLTQMLALSALRSRIIWVTSKSMYTRNPYLHPYCDQVYFVETEGKALGDFLRMRELSRFLRREKVEKVVFNTAQGGHIRNLAFLLSKRIRAYGIIHTVRKFEGSFTQRIIHRMIKRYVVLSDDLLQRISAPEGIHIGSFYPLDFPEGSRNTSKPDGSIRITITGGVESRRKDLAAVKSLLEQTPAQVHFIFLGKTDRNREDTTAFLTALDEANLTDRVTLFDDFVDFELFDSMLAETDFLLPLIHPGTPSADQYISNQISGAFNLAYSYHIPLLIHAAYEQEADLQASSFFYHPGTFGDTLHTAIANRNVMVSAIAENPKWNKAFQRKKFLEFLELPAS